VTRRGWKQGAEVAAVEVVVVECDSGCLRLVFGLIHYKQN